jgi:hypothetical protein
VSQSDTETAGHPEALGPLVAASGQIAGFHLWPVCWVDVGSVWCFLKTEQRKFFCSCGLALVSAAVVWWWGLGLVLFLRVTDNVLFVFCLFVSCACGFGESQGLSALFLMESLILAQDERWRRASHMQVERISSEVSGERVSNT